MLSELRKLDLYAQVITLCAMTAGFTAAAIAGVTFLSSLGGGGIVQYALSALLPIGAIAVYSAYFISANTPDSEDEAGVPLGFLGALILIAATTASMAYPTTGAVNILVLLVAGGVGTGYVCGRVVSSLLSGVAADVRRLAELLGISSDGS